MAKRLTNIQKRMADTRPCRVLCNSRGETITEVLVSMVIVGLALLMLAVVIATSSNIVRSSSEDMANYYERSNTLTTLQGTTPMTIVVSAGSSSVKLSPDDLQAGISVNAKIDESNADKPIVAYEKEA